MTNKENQDFKFWIKGIDCEDVAGLLRLRKHFPSTSERPYFYLKGRYKGDQGTYVLTDLKAHNYSEVTKSSVQSRAFGTDVYFWAPSCDPKEFDIDSWFKPRDPIPAIPVELNSGVTVKINPAAGEPKQMLFGEPYEEEKLPYASIYSKATEYGKLAYKLIYKEDELKDEGGLKTNDPELFKLIEMAFEHSYSFPKDILNWLRIVNFDDINALYQAAMGASAPFMEWLQGGSG